MLYWYTCKSLLNTLGRAVEQLVVCLAMLAKEQQSRSKYNSHATPNSSLAYPGAPQQSTRKPQAISLPNQLQADNTFLLISLLLWATARRWHSSFSSKV